LLVPFPRRSLSETLIRSERRHGAQANEARAGVDDREQESDGNAAGGHEKFFEEDVDRPMISGNPQVQAVRTT
jgi:hypothetical protein